MRCSDLASIYRALASPYKVLLIEGSDDFFRDDCMIRYIEAWKAAFPKGELTRLTDLISHKEELHGSLFGTRTLFCVLEGVKAKKEEEVLSILQERAEGSDLLFVDKEPFPKELSAYAEQNGAFFSLPAIKPWDRLAIQVNWIQAFVKKRGKQIDASGAALLAKGYAQDRRGLGEEIEKLVTYCFDEPMISASHVEQIGVVELQPTLWQLLDGLLAGDMKAIASCATQTSDIYDIALIRFLKNQLEKLVMAAEDGTPSRNRSQERQLASVRKRGIPTIIAWINRLKMHEVGIRSGTEEVQEGTLLPFLLSLARSHR